MSMSKEDIDWDRQAKHFLEQHNWEFDEHGMGFHPLFPFGQDCSMERFAEFCLEFYKDAWTSYRSLIDSIVLLDDVEEESA